LRVHQVVFAVTRCRPIHGAIAATIAATVVVIGFSGYHVHCVFIEPTTAIGY